MALVMRNTLRFGRRAGAASSLGVLTGNLVHIGYAALGLGWLIAHSRLGYDALRYAGAAYLTYLGFNCLRAAYRGDAQLGEAKQRAGSPYVQGLLNNLLNPKGALFYVGVFTQLITPETPRLQTVALVLTMIATSALFWLLFVWLLQLARVREAILRAARWVDASFGVLLLALALRVALD
jgi:threonine/homoserine/homoserine lactone efflux protein